MTVTELRTRLQVIETMGKGGHLPVLITDSEYKPEDADSIAITNFADRGDVVVIA